MGGNEGDGSEPKAFNVGSVFLSRSNKTHLREKVRHDA